MSLPPILNALGLPFLIGAGGIDYCKSGDEFHTWTPECEWQHHAYLHAIAAQRSPNLNALSIWITRHWQEEWFTPEVIRNEVVEKGYTPIFIFYWFADDISREYVNAHRDEYFKALDRFTHYLQQIPSEKVVILNPEFNQADIPDWPGFNRLLSESLRQVKQVDGVKAGFCLGDFGDYDKVDDPDNWKLFDLSIRDAVKQSDFIAFQEMRALTRNGPLHILKTAERSLNLAKYLHQRYQKPTLLGYLALSSLGPDADYYQEYALKEYARLMPRFKSEADLIGFNYFHYFDQPAQVGYFLDAEPHFGLNNRYGIAKESLGWFNRIQ